MSRRVFVRTFVVTLITGLLFLVPTAFLIAPSAKLAWIVGTADQVLVLALVAGLAVAWFTRRRTGRGGLP